MTKREYDSLMKNGGGFVRGFNQKGNVNNSILSNNNISGINHVDIQGTFNGNIGFHEPLHERNNS